MDVERQPVRGGRLGQPVDPLDGQLVVAVDEVDLEALDAQCRVVGARLLELGVEHVGHGPQDEAHAPLVGVAHQLGKVDGRDRRHHVAALRVGPPLVEHDVLQTVRRREVDVGLVGARVDPRFEVDVGQAPVVPPLPRHLAGLDPRAVGDAALGAERIDQIVGRQLAGLVGHGHDAPRIGARALHAGDAIVPRRHPLPTAPLVEVAAVGQGGEQALQRPLSGVRNMPG